MAKLFNFLIKFGLSRETPVTTSLGTQIGRAEIRKPTDWVAVKELKVSYYIIPL